MFTTPFSGLSRSPLNLVGLMAFTNPLRSKPKKARQLGKKKVSEINVYKFMTTTPFPKGVKRNKLDVDDGGGGCDVDIEAKNKYAVLLSVVGIFVSSKVFFQYPIIHGKWHDNSFSIS